MKCCHQTLFSGFFFGPFWPNFFTFLTNYPFLCLSPYVSSCSWQTTRNIMWLVTVHQTVYSWHQLSDCHTIYLTIELLKQFILPTGSCASTSSAALSASHGSKFRTSWTWCWDQQSSIRNMMISDSTNCLLYRVSGFSIPSWLTCWVCERPAMLSDTFQRAEDLGATGVLTSSLQDNTCVDCIVH